MSMAKQTERLEIRVTVDELKTLDTYCQMVDLNRSDVLREYIQTLKKKIKKMNSEV
jgi:anti-sigma28 factor (negative regulator of flagellin synthesis)